MKKRWKLITNILCIAIAICSCSGKTTARREEPGTTVDKNEQEENVNQSKLDVLRPMAYGTVENLKLEPGSYISIIGRANGGSYWDEVKAGAERAVADINAMLGYKGDDKIRINYSAPNENDNMDEQINIFDEELARYPVAVGISTIDASAYGVQFDLAAENGIPIVAFDSGSEQPGVAATCTTNNAEAAKTAATKLCSAIDEYGEIAVFVQDSKSMSAKEREKAFINEVAANYPNVSTVSIYHMDQLAEKAEEIAAEKNAAKAEGEEEIKAESITQEDVVKYILEKNPNIKGIFAANADTTQLVADVMAELKREDVKIVGFDGGSAQMKLLEKGKVEGLIVQNPYGMGYAAVIAMARTALNMGNEAVIDSGYTWVTKDNMTESTIEKMLY